MEKVPIPLTDPGSCEANLRGIKVRCSKYNGVLVPGGRGGGVLILVIAVVVWPIGREGAGGVIIVHGRSPQEDGRRGGENYRPEGGMLDFCFSALMTDPEGCEPTLCGGGGGVLSLCMAVVVWP